MVIVPLEADGIFADAFGGKRFGGWFEHGQRTRSELGRLPALTASLGALFFAHGTRAGSAKKDERVMGNVAVGPFNVYSSAGGEVDLD